MSILNLILTPSHINIALLLLHNKILIYVLKSGDIEVVHCPTKLMIADILTKPLQPAQFLYLRDYLLGYKIPEKGCVK